MSVPTWCFSSWNGLRYSGGRVIGVVPSQENGQVGCGAAHCGEPGIIHALSTALAHSHSLVR